MALVTYRAAVLLRPHLAAIELWLTFLHHAHHPMSILPIAWVQGATRHDFLQITGKLMAQSESQR